LFWSDELFANEIQQLGARSPLLSVPSRATNPDALHTLATVFHGPIEVDTITWPPRINEPGQEVNHDDEKRAAQDLYVSYIAHNSRLWTDITTHADTVALKDLALSAINLLKAVVTATWDGLKSIMEDPARSTVIPWLLAPPKTFSNLVGGHGDAESAAYKIAMAKFDVLRAFHDRIKMGGADAVLLGAVRERIAEGPWGRGGDVGGRIGTLEM
jgi:hypothetical protein